MCKGDGTLLPNLLLNENHLFHKRTLHISGTFKEPEKANIDVEKANIGTRKANIEAVFTATELLIFRCYGKL